MDYARRIQEARRSGRVRTRAEGSCKSQRGFEWSIQYEDLSRGGCRVDDPRHGLELGAVVQLEIAGTGPYPAEVAWRQGDRVGLEFKAELSEEVFHHLANEQWEEAKTADRDKIVRFPVRCVL